MNKNNEIKIESITCKPKSEKRYSFSVNDNTSHTIENEKLYQYLYDFLDGREIGIMKNYIKTFTSFIVYPEINRVIKLKFDLEKERENVRKETRTEKYMLDNNIHKKTSKKSVSDLIKDISKKNMKKSIDKYIK